MSALIFPGAIDLTGWGPHGHLDPLKSDKLCTVHRCYLDHVEGLQATDPFDRLVEFYLRHPEGVATTTLSGSYLEKKPTIDRWKRDGIPKHYLERAYPAYHFALDETRVAQLLPLDRCGAHARGANQTSLSVAVMGDFRAPDELSRDEKRYIKAGAPTPLLVENLRRFLARLYDHRGGFRLQTHSESNERMGVDLDGKGRSKKRCPGGLLEAHVWAMRPWLETRAGHLRQGPGRR